MLEIILILLAGIGVGFLLKDFNKIISISENLANISIYFLLFFLGVSVGIKDKIFNNLESIGLTALIITIFAVLGSMLAAFIVSKIIRDNKNEK